MVPVQISIVDLRAVPVCTQAGKLVWLWRRYVKQNETEQQYIYFQTREPETAEAVVASNRQRQEAGVVAQPQLPTCLCLPVQALFTVAISSHT